MLYALIDCSNKKSFRKISAEEILGEVKVIIPKFKAKSNKRYAKKVIKKIEGYKVENIILSKELTENTEFCKLLEEKKKYIITGRRIGKVILLKLINEISRYTRFPKEKMNILLMMNEYSIENMDLIEWVSTEVKELQVISRNYSKYEKLANRLFEQYGCVIKLYDNECLNEFKRVNIIINLDFKEESFKQINIAKNSIVISLNEKIENLKKGFNGIVVNDIDIAKNEEICLQYRGLALCEARIYKPLRKLKDNERIFNGEKYIINGYIGKRGKITEEEFEKIGKTFA